MSSLIEYVGLDVASVGMAVDVLDILVKRAYNRAKRRAYAALLFQTVLFVTGVLAIFWPD